MAAAGLGKDVPLTAGNILEVRYQCVAGDQIGLSVFHYRCFEVFGTVVLGTVATELGAALGPLLVALLPAAAGYLGTDVRRLRPAPISPLAYDQVGSGGGTAVGDVLPRQVAAVITKQTQFAGQAYRGRFYVPFPGEGDNDSAGKPLAAYLTRLQSLATYLKGVRPIGITPNNANLRPVLWHRVTGTYDDLLDTRANGRWGTQRRRGSYGQRNLNPYTGAPLVFPAVESFAEGS